MLRHLSLSCLLFAMMASTNTFAAKAPKVGKTRGVNLPAYQRSGDCADDAEWKEVKNDKTFRQLDCFKTGPGGSIRLELTGNDIFTIPENAKVNVDELVEETETGVYGIKLDIKKGYMGFKAEKNKGHEVDFRTGTAAASIRGTEGFIGINEKTFFASLKNGKLNVKLKPNESDSLSIVEGETVLGRGEFVILKLKSSGDTAFAKILNNIVSDTTLSIEKLKLATEAADSIYQRSLNASNDFADTSKVSSASLNDSLKADTIVQTSVQPVEPVKPAEAVKVPRIRYSSYDSLRCVANVVVYDVQKGSGTRLSTLVDGTSFFEVGVERNTSKRLALQNGVHEYEFVVENSAGHNSVSKTLGCYPLKPFSVKILGNKHVRLQIPPAPPSSADDVITQTLQFQIRLPENDPSFLNKVVVRQNGKPILEERLSQIQDLDYQVPIELKRGLKHRIEVEVIHKSGYTVKTNMVYEVSE